MASTSAMDAASAAQRWSYDVFLSFKAEDTGNTFTGFLYSNLRQKGINTFILDRKLVREEEITTSVLKAIEESRIVLVIFSQNYASCAWCLDELAKAIECSEPKNGQTLIPIFYRIDPSHVRKQKGAVGTAMQEHEIKFKNNLEKVRRWRDALYNAANLSGRHLSDGHEPDFVETIVKEVSTRIYRPRYVPKNLVGVGSHLKQLTALLNLASKDVLTVGIYGIGGIGKTTIAEVLYNSVAESFENRSFLASVRDTSKQYNGLIQLQEKLLSDTLGKNTRKLGSIAEGIEQIRYKLQNKKVLIVLDDVDSLNQLEALSGSDDWFGRESRIIITTRDKHLLVVQGVKRTHKLSELNDKDALEIICRNAFGTAFPPEEFEEVSSDLVNYAEGLPLALAILGKFLRGRSMIEWESKIESLETFLDQEIYKVLKVSFDGLAFDEKAIFLDIACFFNGKKKHYAMEVLNSCYVHPDLGIKVLTDKSLINVDSEKLHMHHLLQQMGREIVRQESQNPGKRSRLWFHEDVLRVLEENTGTDAIEGIVLDPPSSKRIQLHGNAFLKMKRLRLLIVNNLHFHGKPNCLSNELRWLEWSGYPSHSLPTEFHPRNLVGLKLSLCWISQLWWVHSKSCSTLASLELTRCGLLREIPDVSKIPNLQKLIIIQCRNLVMVHDSVGFLDKLVRLEIVDCSALRRIPTKLRLKSLEELLLTGCPKLKDFPEIMEGMVLVRVVNVSLTGMKKLPGSIKNLTGLKFLDLSYCKNLEQLPSSIYNLSSLEVLNLDGCTRIHETPSSNNEISRDCDVLVRKLTKLDDRYCRRRHHGVWVGARRLGLGLRLKLFRMKRRTRN